MLIVGVLGRIHRRFAEGSADLEELRGLIRDKASGRDETPLFSVHERGARENLCALDRSVTHDMTRGKFTLRSNSFKIRHELSETELHFTLSEEQTHAISGFPRCLVDDDEKK
jgi:hypothetical protein